MKEIKLNGKHGGVALVDDEDYAELSKYKWHSVKDTHTMYAGRRDKWPIHTKKTMHRHILNLTDPKVIVDHKDGNGLNNQRHNLRICTHSQNIANKHKTHGSSMYLGVNKCIVKANGSLYSYWLAKCTKDTKKYAKTFKTEVEAALWYNEKAKELHGEFANLNIIQQEQKKHL